MIREPLLTTFYALLFSVFARFYGISHPWMDWWMVAHSLPLEIDLFVTGMFTAYAFRALATQYGELTHPSLAWAWTLLALSGIALYCLSCTYVHGYHGSNLQTERQILLSLDVSFASVTLGSLFGLPAWKAIFSNSIVKFYAVISYNLYLWHLLLFPFLAKLHEWSFLKHIEAPYSWPLFCLISIFCCSAVAAALTYGIERPLMRLRFHTKPQPMMPYV
jgi:peptidoglycan/LPS O-acetylase OafA/YrhL